MSWVLMDALTIGFRSARERPGTIAGAVRSPADYSMFLWGQLLEYSSNIARNLDILDADLRYGGAWVQELA